MQTKEPNSNTKIRIYKSSYAKKQIRANLKLNKSNNECMVRLRYYESNLEQWPCNSCVQSNMLADLPNREQKQHSGIFVMSYSCRNSQLSPFLQRPRSQCLQTTRRSPRTCRNGQETPLLQVPDKKQVHIADPDSKSELSE